MTTRGRKLLSRPKRQEVILQGAATAFAAKGFAGTSMEEVAAASGITKEIVYRNFASKEDLYRAVLERTVERIRSEFSRITHTSPSGAGIRRSRADRREGPRPRQRAPPLRGQSARRLSRGRARRREGGEASARSPPSRRAPT